MSNDPMESYLDLVQKDLRRKSSFTKQKIKSLRLQRNFLTELAVRHKFWSKHTANSEATSLHAKLIDSIQQTIYDYDSILGVYERDDS